MKPNKTTRTYNLPDGRTTTSDEKYTKEWSNLAVPVAEALDCMVISMNPDIVLERTGGGHPFDLPVYVAKRIKWMVDCIGNTKVRTPWGFHHETR